MGLAVQLIMDESQNGNLEDLCHRSSKSSLLSPKSLGEKVVPCSKPFGGRGGVGFL